MADLLHHRGQAAGVEEVFHQETAGRLQVDQAGHLRAELVPVVELELHAHAAGRASDRRWIELQLAQDGEAHAWRQPHTQAAIELTQRRTAIDEHAGATSHARLTGVRQRRRVEMEVRGGHRNARESVVLAVTVAVVADGLAEELEAGVVARALLHAHEQTAVIGRERERHLARRRAVHGRQRLQWPELVPARLALRQRERRRGLHERPERRREPVTIRHAKGRLLVALGRTELAIKEYEDLKLTLLYKYDEKLLESNAELGVYLENEKIFEASRTQFREVMKTRCAALLSALKIKIDDKNAKIQLYLKMRKYNEERAEKDILALLEDYFKRKKKAKLIWEDDKRKGLSEREAAVNDLLRWMNTDLDRMLMTVETNAFNDAIVSLFSYEETPQYPQERNRRSLFRDGKFR